MSWKLEHARINDDSLVIEHEPILECQMKSHKKRRKNGIFSCIQQSCLGQSVSWF